MQGWLIEWRDRMGPVLYYQYGKDRETFGWTSIPTDGLVFSSKASAQNVVNAWDAKPAGIVVNPHHMGRK